MKLKKVRKRVYNQEQKERMKVTHRDWYLKNRAHRLSQAMSFKRTLKGRFGACRLGARNRKIPFELSFNQYIQLIDNALCNYCKSPLPETGGGLDRVDSSVGYTVSNVVTCCFICNTMFGALDKEVAYRHMQNILNIRQSLK